MTRTTLQQVRQGVSAEDWVGLNAMSMRSAAAHAVWKDEKSVVNAAVKFMFTHQNEEALGGAKFFAKVAHRIIHQVSPQEKPSTR